jgi:hypothetical protein
MVATPSPFAWNSVGERGPNRGGLLADNGQQGPSHRSAHSPRAADQKYRPRKVRRGARGGPAGVTIREATSLGTTPRLRRSGPAPSDSATGGREGMESHLRPVTVTPTKAGSAPPSARQGSPAVPDPIDLAERADRLQADCQLRDALAAQGVRRAGLRRF